MNRPDDSMDTTPQQAILDALGDCANGDIAAVVIIMQTDDGDRILHNAGVDMLSMIGLLQIAAADCVDEARGVEYGDGIDTEGDEWKLA